MKSAARFTLPALLFALLVVLPPSLCVSANLTLANGTAITMLHYERGDNASYSYADNTKANPDVYLKLCGLNASYLNALTELLYASESGNITVPLLSLPSQIYFINFSDSSNCSLINIEISTFEALYPGIPFLRINLTPNASVFEKLNQSLNGSFVLGVGLDDVSGMVFLSVQKILDDKGLEITNASKNNLILSIVSNSTPVMEARVSPKQVASFHYSFSTGDQVFVNGIPSLKVKVIPPCTVVNETGYYYIINDSAWNLGDTCLIIENTSSIVIDFGNHTIDGDANQTFIHRKCGLTVRNAQNVTLKDVRIQQFGYGICVFNSNGIKILGTSAQANLHGIVVENSSVKLSRIKMINNGSEIIGRDNGRIELDVVYLATANVSAHVKDVMVASVPNPPPDPEGLQNISQWVNMTRNGESWLYNLGFTFPFPPPNNVIPKYIYRYAGAYANNSWNGTWEALTPTYVDVAKRIVFSPLNLTSFSIFAPFGEKIPPQPKPKPKPVPKPKPTPRVVEREREKIVPPKLNLTLHVYEITLQQGETRSIGFNLTNEGNVVVLSPRVVANVRRGWKTSEVVFEKIEPGETLVDKFYIQVYENEIPGTYLIPVRAVIGEDEKNVTVDVEILKVIVIPRQRVAKIDILEILPYLELPENYAYPISVLVENTGDYDLHDLTLTIEGAEKCIEKIEGRYDLKKGEKKALRFVLHTKRAGAKCTGVYVFRSREGVVGMYPVIIKIRPQKLVEKIKIFPVIYLIWTLITIYVIYRRVRYGR